MSRLPLGLCGVVVIGCAIGAAGSAAALTVSIVQPAESPYSADALGKLRFEAVACEDGTPLDNAGVQWHWQFGDGQQSMANPTTHAYVASGEYTLRVSAAVGGAVATAAMQVVVRGRPQTPRCLPSDPSLSVYVGFRGLWSNNVTMDVDAAELEASVAVFGPGEKVNDTPDAWGRHLMTEARIPPGWLSFMTEEDTEVRMRMIVRDTRARLGAATLTDRDTGAAVGTLTANAGGSEIAGFIDVSSAGRYLTLTLTDRSAGDVICRFAIDRPESNDVVVVTHTYGFDANLGDEHECWLTEGCSGPWGDPDSVEGKVSIERPDAHLGCAGGTSFENDYRDRREVRATYDLMDRAILKDITLRPLSLTNNCYASIKAELEAIRAQYADGRRFLEPYVMPPFSRGEAHWGAYLEGAVTSVICFPYMGRPEQKDTISNWIEWTLPWKEGIGSPTPAAAVVAKTKLWDYQRRASRVGEPIAIGDIWTRTATAWGREPTAMPLEAITAPATFMLLADKAEPDDTEALVGGDAYLSQGRAWTDHSPPCMPRAPSQLAFAAEGEEKGTRTLELAKGYRYEVTSARSPVYDTIYALPAGGMEFSVRGKQDVRIELRLLVARELVVRSEQAGGKPVPAAVIVSDSSGKGVRAASTEDDGHGHCSCIFRDLPAPARYSLRAKPRGGSDSEYGDLRMVILKASTLPQIVIVRVGGPQP